jgi:PilZ domain
MNTQTALPARFHPRVDAGFLVKLSTNGRSIVAKAADLSMAGLKLLGEFGSIGDRLAISVPLPGDREVRTVGTIRRTTEEGVAVEFDQLDWDDMFALARFVHPRL